MKRILFYSLLVVQAVVLLLLGSQNYLTKAYGEEVELLIKNQGYDMYQGTTYVDYKINILTKDIWEIDEELNYRDKVYVVLTPDETGIFHATKATTEKPIIEGNQRLITGYFHFMDQTNQSYRVNYDIEEVRENVQNAEKITIKIAPWGHKTIVQVGNK